VAPEEVCPDSQIATSLKAPEASLRAERSNPGITLGAVDSWIASSPFRLLAMTVAPLWTNAYWRAIQAEAFMSLR
jgi:hypothetical protein